MVVNPREEAASSFLIVTDKIEKPIYLREKGTNEPLSMKLGLPAEKPLPPHIDKVLHLADIDPLKENFFSLAVTLPFAMADGDNSCQILVGKQFPKMKSKVNNIGLMFQPKKELPLIKLRADLVKLTFTETGSRLKLDFKISSQARQTLAEITKSPGKEGMQREVVLYLVPLCIPEMTTGVRDAFKILLRLDFNWPYFMGIHI